MLSTHVKSSRKCPTCGAPMYVRKDVVADSAGHDRVDTMLVCRDESCAEPARHLRTEHPPEASNRTTPTTPSIK